MTKIVKNEENLNRLLDWLDNGAEHVVLNMATPMTSQRHLGAPACGTACCIAGAAHQMRIGTFGEPVTYEVEDFHEIQASAAEFLGVNLADNAEGLDALFLGDVGMYYLRGIKPEEAAHALRTFAETGSPDWGDRYFGEQ